mmetsp:Transcript_34716/g.68314  ORF Transcript_34716/g.68314 Transcript_34716/m.68314 type:complete len:208 (-) Transcript_34716:2-625(-)
MPIMWSSTREYRLPLAWTLPPSHAVAHRRHLPPPAWSHHRRPASVCCRSLSDVDSLYELDVSDRYSVASSFIDLPRGTAVAADDPRLSLSYGEFPLSSFEAAFNYARQELDDTAGRRTLVDLGSGCGRIVLHAAASLRATTDEAWDVTGIEISEELHSLAEGARRRAVARDVAVDGDRVRVRFRCGPAAEYGGVLGGADVVFCYSTA